MSTALSTDLSQSIPAAGSYFVLDDVSWDFYERTLEELDGTRVRISYDNGRMVFMSPLLPKHEWTKKRIARMIEMATLQWNIPVYSLGQTTWKSRVARKGLEPDECYYIQHEPEVRSRDKLDLRRDPPPDLVVEVEVTHHPIDRLAIYAGLKINEVWIHDGKKVKFLKLGRGGQYRSIARSEALPRLTPADIERFLNMFESAGETEIFRAFQDWLGHAH
jgi:Uma2 family endonuclease